MKTVTLSTRPSDRRIASHIQTDRTQAKALQIRNVLVPVDFSVASSEALDFALPLVERFGAALHMVHVFEPDYSLAAMAAMPLIIPELEVGRRVRRHLKDVARKHGIELRRENIHCLKGRPFEEICALARDCQMDLIVIATRGNTGLKHLTLGSTAERVVRYSSCPVLVVRDHAQTKKASRNGKSPRRALAFHKILVPMDFSACSMKSLEYAKRLAKEFNATLILLHSVALQYYVANDEYRRYDFPLLLEQSEKAAQKQLRDLIAKIKQDGVKVESSLQIGHAGQQICARADVERADVIVTSTHGYTGLKHVLMGSTAEFVVRHAACPVLVVPSHVRPAIISTKTQT